MDILLLAERLLEASRRGCGQVSPKASPPKPWPACRPTVAGQRTRAAERHLAHAGAAEVARRPPSGAAVLQPAPTPPRGLAVDRFAEVGFSGTCRSALDALEARVLTRL